MYDKLHKFGILDGMLAAGLGLITVGVGAGVRENFKLQTSNIKVELIKNVTPSVAQGDNKVTFDIVGEVVKPGVYTLEAGSRISEALAIAGGLSANADREWVELNINRAKRIGDGEKIFIPRRQQTQSGGQAGTKIEETPRAIKVLGVQSGGLINLNTASIAELDTLEGIGPALAQRIIDYRDKNNGFRDVNEIKLVSGIGDKLFEKIREKIGI